MTSTLQRGGAAGPSSRELPPPRGDRHPAPSGEPITTTTPATSAIPRRRIVAAVVTTAILTCGVAALASSFRLAADSHTRASFVVFWFGFLSGLAVLATHAVATRSSDLVRWLSISAIGLWFFVPKLLRNPSAPLFHDELAHWAATDAALRNEHLFNENTLVPITRLYPGMQAAVTGLVSITGLPIWHVAIVLMAAWKVMALVAVTLIALRLGASMQTAAIAAVVYAVNPSFMFFHSQFAYESWALVLLLWTVVAALSAFHPSNSPVETRWWLSTGAVTAVALVTTHHLTAYMLVIVLALTMLGRAPNTGVARPVTRLRVLWAVIGITLAYQVSVTGNASVAYYRPYLEGAWEEVGNLLSRQESSHTLFAGTLAPSYERIAAFASPLVTSAVALIGLMRLRRHPRRPRGLTAMCLFGLLYFASLPVLLSESGNEGARRSWGFTFVGMAMLIAVAVSPQWSPRWPEPSRRPRLLAVSGIAALSLVVVGNTTTGINVEYRFPGEYVYGSDTRSLTDEVIELSRWVDGNYGSGNRVLSDRFTNQALASFGRQRTAVPSEGFPIWRMFFEPLPDDDPLIAQLRDSGYSLMIVDDRMAEYLPRTGFYFSFDEPLAHVRTEPVDRAVLDRFHDLPWLRQVHVTDHFTVYEFDFDRLAANGSGGA